MANRDDSKMSRQEAGRKGAEARWGNGNQRQNSGKKGSSNQSYNLGSEGQHSQYDRNEGQQGLRGQRQGLGGREGKGRYSNFDDELGQEAGRQGRLQFDEEDFEDTERNFGNRSRGRHPYQTDENEDQFSDQPGGLYVDQDSEDEEEEDDETLENYPSQTSRRRSGLGVDHDENDRELGRNRGPYQR